MGKLAFNKMIGVTFQGRLGNQLFQYAFAISASEKIGVNFFMDQSQQRGIIYEYFNIENSATSFLASKIFNISGYKNIFNHYLRKAFATLLKLLFINKTQLFSLTQPVNTNDFENKKLYIGYFQSELFFVDYKEIIKSKFTIKDKFRDKFNTQFSNLYKEKIVVAVHIRKGDYVDQQHLNLGNADISLPLNYYHKVLKPYLTAEHLIIFLSDESSYLESEFSYISNKIISTGNVITDFQHLLNANICIIANSTFSWWAAYLNANKDKRIYAPQHFLGYNINETVPPYIYPEDWIIVPVDSICL
ncbi:hypothetical protein DF947_13955 [Pedobacter paludis]|uniref:Alpha-1,2-fucosyltransferase n=2 Tax=Pedobacter paludis TaxID=2203212 RepID=A0A317EYP4_9SPHI|nr:hypothetical protein DF947_13955 [Pedobacter paludis]